MLKHSVNATRSTGPMSPAMRFFFTIIFPWIFILVGGGILYAGVTNLRRASASKDWPAVPGKVVLSELHKHRSDKGSVSYSAKVMYDYKVDGTEYSADRVTFGSGSSSNPSGANMVLKKYQKNTEVTVHYSPGDPTLAVLEPGVSGTTLMLPAMGSVFFLAGCAMAFFLPAAMRKDGAQQATPPLP